MDEKYESMKAAFLLGRKRLRILEGNVFVNSRGFFKLKCLLKSLAIKIEVNNDERK